MLVPPSARYFISRSLASVTSKEGGAPSKCVFGTAVVKYRSRGGTAFTRFYGHKMAVVPRGLPTKPMRCHCVCLEQCGGQELGRAQCRTSNWCGGELSGVPVMQNKDNQAKPQPVSWARVSKCSFRGGKLHPPLCPAPGLLSYGMSPTHGPL